MIAIPQADLLNMLPVTQVTPLAAKALEAGSTTPRFDVALLEAAKTMRDSAPQAPELTLVPRVRQAFEAALSELSQKPLDQLKSLAQQPQAARPETAAIVMRAAQAAGLSAEETAVLQDLVPLALPRVAAFKAAMMVPGTPVENTKNGGVQPGPQGGNPVKTADPADPIQALEPGLNSQPLGPDEQHDNTNTQDTPSPLQALNHALPAPALVSTRTDDGSSRNGALTLSRSNAVPAPVAAAAPVATVTSPAPAAGRVIQISTVQPVQPVTQAATAPAPLANAPAPVPVPATATATAPNQAPAPKQANVPNAPAPAAAPQREAQAPAGNLSAPKAAPSPATAANSTSPAPSIAPEVLAGLDVQFQSPTKPLAVVPGSELTLQEDGTWSQPEAAKAPAMPQPQGSVKAPVLSATELPQAPAPVQANSTAPQAPAPVAADPAKTPVAAPAVQAAATAPTTAAPAPVARPVESPAPARAEASRGADAFEAFQAPAASESVVSRRSAGDSAFNSLAQFGQDPMKALAQQTAREYAVRESVFAQVTQALREAPGADNGRMHIRLKPAELGEVSIDLVMRNGKLSARLVASHAEVRDAFVRDLPAFKAGLESQGVAVRDISVAVRAGVADQQQQQQPQPQDPRALWRELPQDAALAASVPLNTGYAASAGALDQRFSALA